MQSIPVTSDFTLDEFDAATKIWMDSTDCEVLFPEFLSEDAIRHLLSLAIKRVPSDFAFCVLESPAEFNNTPDDLLLAILKIDERSCIEAVCLRSDLSVGLRKVCEQMAQHNPVKPS